MGDVLPLLSNKIVIKRLGVCVLRENILSISIIGIYSKIATLLVKSLIFFAMSRLILKKTTFANILPIICICSQHLRLYKFQAEIFYLILIGIFILSFEIKKQNKNKKYCLIFV